MSKLVIYRTFAHNRQRRRRRLLLFGQVKNIEPQLEQTSVVPESRPQANWFGSCKTPGQRVKKRRFSGF